MPAPYEWEWLTNGRHSKSGIFCFVSAPTEKVGNNSDDIDDDDSDEDEKAKPEDRRWLR